MQSAGAFLKSRDRRHEVPIGLRENDKSGDLIPSSAAKSRYPTLYRVRVFDLRRPAPTDTLMPVHATVGQFLEEGWLSPRCIRNLEPPRIARDRRGAHGIELLPIEIAHLVEHHVAALTDDDYVVASVVVMVPIDVVTVQALSPSAQVASDIGGDSCHEAFNPCLEGLFVQQSRCSCETMLRWSFERQ